MPAITIPGTSIKYGWQEREKGWGPGMNTNLLVLGVIAKGQVVSRTTTAPPANPDEGDAYIIPADATGAWSGRENKIAAYFSGAWVYIEPVGTPIYIEDEGDRVVWNGASYTVLSVALESGFISRVANITALRALTGMQANQTVEMVTTGRAGLFRWDDSDLSAEVTADTQMGIYVPPTGQDGSSGAWVRVYSGAVDVRWFGAIGDGVTDDSAAIQGALDQCNNVVVADGNYYCATGVTIESANTVLEFFGGGALVYTEPTMTLITANAEGVHIIGAVIDAPAVFDGTNEAPTYSVIRFNADWGVVERATLRNVPKLGIWFKDCNNGRVSNSRIDGGTAEGFFTGTNTVHFGISIDAAPDGSQGNFTITGNIIRKCVQGCSFGNRGAASFEQAASATGNVFELCWNHGWYTSGFGNGHTISGNAFNSCQIPIALTGKNHVVSGNAIAVQTSGGALGTDNERTGISLRDPRGCVIVGNSLKGEATPGDAIISLEDLSSVDGGNEVANNVVTGNTIEITNPDAASVVAIRLRAEDTRVRNNVVSGNVIMAPVREFQGLISLLASSASASEGNSVSDNTIVINGADGNGYGVYLSNITDSVVTNNRIRLEFDAASTRVIIAVALSVCERVLLHGNHIRCSELWGTNITFRGFSEITSGAGNEIIDNKVSFDGTKLAGSLLFNVSSTSGIKIVHAGEGSPEGVVISGPGGIWRRTDGGGAPVLYVKETGTSNTGWSSKVTPLSGTATVTTGNTSVTVSHGLTSAPNAGDINVTPTNSLGSATKFWVSNITSTNFDINVDIDPAGDATFAWSATA